MLSRSALLTRVQASRLTRPLFMIGLQPFTDLNPSSVDPPERKFSITPEPLVILQWNFSPVNQISLETFLGLNPIPLKLLLMRQFGILKRLLSSSVCRSLVCKLHVSQLSQPMASSIFIILQGVRLNFPVLELEYKRLFCIVFIGREQTIYRWEACNFILKETLAQVFSSEFCEISKNTFLQSTTVRLFKSKLHHWIFQGTLNQGIQYSFPYGHTIWADLVTFTEEVLNGKLNFLRSESKEIK